MVLSPGTARKENQMIMAFGSLLKKNYQKAFIFEAAIAIVHIPQAQVYLSQLFSYPSYIEACVLIYSQVQS